MAIPSSYRSLSPTKVNYHKFKLPTHTIPTHFNSPTTFMDSLLHPKSMPLVFLSIVLSVLIAGILAGKVRQKQGKKRYHPVGGTIFNQLINFNRLHDYMTDLATLHRTYRLITPFRSEVYTSDPANVEYILKTKFDNYGKVSLIEVV